FDKYRGWLVNVLRAKYFATSRSTRTLDFAFRLNSVLSELEKKLTEVRLIKPSADDILDARLNLAERFRGADAVIHLAALAHADIPGFDEDDYRRINYEGGINGFEAAQKAGVHKFAFCSAGGVY